MSKWQYTKGLHDLGNGCFAWLQPDGGWGFSNAGLIVDGDQSLLVDTLFDLALTGEMLGRMRAAVPAAKSIGRLVNTHANGDHTFGNQLVAGAEIIASRACAEEMKERPAEELAAMQRNWRQLGEAGAFLHEVMGSKFKWDDVREHAADAGVRGRAAAQGRRQGRAAQECRAGAYAGRRPGPRARGSHRLHRRHPVRRGPSRAVGRPGRQLGGRLRPHPRLGRRDRGAGPRPDHRQGGRAGDEGLPPLHQARGAQALRCRHAGLRRGARHRARPLRRLGRSGAHGGQRRLALPRVRVDAASSTSWSSSARWVGCTPNSRPRRRRTVTPAGHQHVH